MAAKGKARLAPRMDVESLTENFREQVERGTVFEALAVGMALPSLESLRGQPVRIDQSLLRGVTLSGAPDGTRAERLVMADVRVEGSDLSNLDMSEGRLERVEFVETRLTGANLRDVRLKSVLFQECKLDLAMLRMARFEACVFERCRLTEADFYGADLSGVVFRGCDLGRADLSQARLGGADLRDCRLDGMRGMPAEMNGLMISPDQAALLITLFGVKVG